MPWVCCCVCASVYLLARVHGLVCVFVCLKVTVREIVSFALRCSCALPVYALCVCVCVRVRARLTSCMCVIPLRTRVPPTRR